jgi:hypothetical protein
MDSLDSFLFFCFLFAITHVNWPVTTKKKKTETLKTLQNRSLYVKTISVLFEPAIQMRKGELWAHNPYGIKLRFQEKTEKTQNLIYLIYKKESYKMRPGDRPGTLRSSIKN